jgi:hypothetical protein
MCSGKAGKERSDPAFLFYYIHPSKRPGSDDTGRITAGIPGY